MNAPELNRLSTAKTREATIDPRLVPAMPIWSFRNSGRVWIQSIVRRMSATLWVMVATIRTGSGWIASSPERVPFGARRMWYGNVTSTAPMPRRLSLSARSRSAERSVAPQK